MKIRRSWDDKPTLIDLNDIDTSLGPSSMSFGFELEPLMESIQRFGLINTPFVSKNRDGRLNIVAGYRRIQALKSLQWEKVPTLNLSDAGLSTLECLLFNLYDNLTMRVFNDVEKGMILSRLIAHLSRDEIMAHYMPLLHLPSHEGTLDLFFRLDELEATIKEAIVNETLSLNAAKRLLDMAPESRISMVNWISDLNFNFNQQLQFIEYTVDISINEKIPIPALLRGEKLLGIFEDKRRNIPQKAKWVIDTLRSLQFPLLTLAEKDFQQTISSLDLPRGVRIKHPPFFEGSDYVLEMRFRNGVQLKEKLDYLSGTPGVEDIRNPWEKD